MSINIDVNFLNNLNNKHFVTKMLDKFFYFFNKIFNVNKFSSKLNN